MPPGFRGDCHGQDPAYMSLEEEHHRGRHRFPAVFHERESPLVPQDPINVIPSEPVLSEAKDFESIQPV